MAHLKKSADGHLLKGPGGHLVNDCTGFEPPPENTCNACDPAIPDTIFVTFAGLAGDFAVANGKQTLSWNTACVWNVHLGDVTVQISWFGGGPNLWILAVSPSAFPCDYTWAKTDVSGCAPEGGTYSLFNCVDTACDDADSCEDSAGATAVVSLT